MGHTTIEEPQPLFEQTEVASLTRPPTDSTQFLCRTQDHAAAQIIGDDVEPEMRRGRIQFELR